MKKFPINYILSSLISENRNQITDEILLNDPFFIKYIQEKRESYTGYYYFNEEFTKTQNNTVSYLKKLENINFYRINLEDYLKAKSLLPIPKKSPDFQYRINTYKFYNIFYELEFMNIYLDDISEIFKLSDLNNSTTPMRSIICNNSYILGYNDFTIYSLSQVAHELGHCIFEKYFTSNSWKLQILSEIFAGVLENIIPTYYLYSIGKSNMIPQWKTYQQAIDNLNIYFYLYEYVHCFKREANIILEDFSEEVVILRESLYTLPGYQLCYAMSTLFKYDKNFIYDIFSSDCKLELQFLNNFSIWKF